LKQDRGGGPHEPKDKKPLRSAEKRRTKKGPSKGTAGELTGVEGARCLRGGESGETKSGNEKIKEPSTINQPIGNPGGDQKGGRQATYLKKGRPAFGKN